MSKQLKIVVRVYLKQNEHAELGTNKFWRELNHFLTQLPCNLHFTYVSIAIPPLAYSLFCLPIPVPLLPFSTHCLYKNKVH